MGVVDWDVGTATIAPRFETIDRQQALLEPLDIEKLIEAGHPARAIERQCAYEPGLRWLTGLPVVNHHPLSDFRVGHGEALQNLFVQVLGILSME